MSDSDTIRERMLRGERFNVVEKGKSQIMVATSNIPVSYSFPSGPYLVDSDNIQCRWVDNQGQLHADIFRVDDLIIIPETLV